MSIDDTTPDGQFCPECGERVQPGDHFCRHCGHALAGTKTDPAPPRRRRRAALVAVALLALTAGAAALVLVLGGAFETDENDTAAAAARGRLAAQRARVKAPFEALMRQRDGLFGQERRYLTAMEDAREKIGRYRRDYKAADAEFKRIDEEFADEFDQCYRFDIPCPEPDYPEYPKVPGFAKQTKQLRAVVSKLDELQAGLASLQPEKELVVLHTQLLASVEALDEEASHNADVLDEAIEPGEGEGTGSLDNGKLRTLRAGSALPAIRQLNAAAASVVDSLELSKLDYDVPGGRDFDAGDHSDET
jgi:zinc ribbon protein